MLDWLSRSKAYWGGARAGRGSGRAGGEPKVAEDTLHDARVLDQREQPQPAPTVRPRDYVVLLTINSDFGNPSEDKIELFRESIYCLHPDTPINRFCMSLRLPRTISRSDSQVTAALCVSWQRLLKHLPRR